MLMMLALGERPEGGSQLMLMMPALGGRVLKGVAGDAHDARFGVVP